MTAATDATKTFHHPFEADITISGYFIHYVLGSSFVALGLMDSLENDKPLARPLQVEDNLSYYALDIRKPLITFSIPPLASETIQTARARTNPPTPESFPPISPVSTGRAPPSERVPALSQRTLYQCWTLTKIATQLTSRSWN